MLMLMLVFGLVTAIYRERGWFSPLVGVAAVLTQPVIEMIFGGTLGVVLFTPDRNVDSYSELAFFGLGLYAAFCTVLLYYLLSRLVPKVDYRKVPKISRVPYRLLGYTIVIGAVLLSVYLIYAGIQTGDKNLSRMVSGIAVLAFFSAGPCFKLGRQQRRAAARWRVLESRRPPILYLRSFELESHSRQSANIGAIGGTSSRTFDEVLESATTDLGVLIALGDPRDYLPTAGAIKVYPSDDNWQSYVTRLAAVSRAVFLVEGNSSGLGWELSYVRQHVEPEKIFIFTTHRKYRKNHRRKEKSSLWEAFSSQLQQAGFDGLAEDPGDGAVLRFDNEWHPRVIARGLKRANAYEAVLRKYLSDDNRVFDYEAISDLIFTGIVETDVADSTIGFRKALQMAALTVVAITVFSGIAVGGWHYLDSNSFLGRAHDEQSANANTPRTKKLIVYKGQALPYSLQLAGIWQQYGRSGDFDLLFEHRGGEAAIGVIAEEATEPALNIDVNRYVNEILNRANLASSEPLQILHRDKRTIDGREWVSVRYRGVLDGIAWDYSLAFALGEDGIYQLLGWTVQPKTYNDEIDAAMDGFRFPPGKNGE